jgi:hypothetical protein
MLTPTAWTNRVKGIVLGLGLALGFQQSEHWWRIYADHVPECGSRTCIADFVPFYAQTMMIWENPRRLYEIDRQHDYQRRVFAHERVLHSPYPPITIALFAPLGRLSFSNAFLVMTVLNVLLLALSLQQLTRGLKLSHDQTIWLLLFSLCNFGVQATLANAQSSFIVLLFFSKFVLAQKTVAAKHAGLSAGMLCIKPQYVVMPHLLLLLHRNWKQLSIGTLVVLLLTAGPFALLGMKAFADFLQIAQVTASQNTWANPAEAMHNLKALTTVWLPTRWNPFAWWAISAVVSTTIGWMNFRAHYKRYDFKMLWILNSLAFLLLSPHLFTHDLSLLIVPCALLLSAGKQTVPHYAGIGLVLIAMLSAINYLVPTIMAAALVVLLLLTLISSEATFWARNRLTPWDTIGE